MATNWSSAFNADDRLFEPQPPSQGGSVFANAARAPQQAAGTGRSRPPMFADGPFGRIASLFGAPTRAQWQQEQSMGARSRGLQQLQQTIASGVAPQKALLDFIATPEGAEMLAADPNALQQAITFAGAVTPEPVEPPDPMVLSAGQRAFDAAGNEIASNPTSEVQTFQDMARLAQLDDQTIAGLAQANIDAARTGDMSDKAAGLAALREAGLISPVMEQKFLAGVVDLIPAFDTANNLIGHTLLDKTNPNSGSQFIPLRSGAPDRPPVPGVDYDPLSEVGTAPGSALGELEAAGVNPAEIVLGAGIIGAMAENLGGFFGNFDPKLAATTQGPRRRALRMIVRDAQNIRGTDDGRSFAADVGLIDQVMNVVDNPWTMNPSQAALTLVAWHDDIDRMMQAAVETAANDQTTQKVRDAAYSRIEALKAAKQNLPSKESLLSIYDQIQVSEPVSEALEQGAEAIDEGQRSIGRQTGQGQTPPAAPSLPEGFAGTFRSEDEVRRAVEAGELKIGDRIVIDDGKGRPRRIRLDP